MRRREFKRCTPEEVGIPSEAIEQLLDALEYGGFTQMHGLMIMRHGKVCAEGWWSPFAPGLEHCDHSLSKTYTATAIGIAEREGLLRLGDRVIDIFPDRAPQDPSERLGRLTVRDLLVMGSGMDDEQPGYPADWLDVFLRTPLEVEPGKRWRYDSHVTTVLSAIVERVSGQDMLEYLTPRLFDRIGIDASRVMCNRAADGVCIGGSGMFTTTEDNLRLMKLYLDGGVFDGERILSEEFVRDATSRQMDTAEAHAHTPWIYDNCVGYGYQIWMCRWPGAYRADGAYGQFSIVVPDLDLIVSINEDGYLGEHMSHNELSLLKGKLGEEAPVHGPQATLNAVFEHLVPQVREEILPPSGHSARLAARMARLCVPRPASGSLLAHRPHRFDCALEPEEGRISFGLLFGMEKNRRNYGGAERIRIRIEGGDCEIAFVEAGREQRFNADLLGGRRTGALHYDALLETRIETAGWWEAENRFCLSLLWTQTELENRFAFTFDGSKVTVEEWIAGGVFGPMGRVQARYRLV